jgi:hypothetical protein
MAKKKTKMDTSVVEVTTLSGPPFLPGSHSQRVPPYKPDRLKDLKNNWRLASEEERAEFRKWLRTKEAEGCELG